MEKIIQKFKMPETRKMIENYGFIILLTIIGALSRIYLFPILSGDYNSFLEPWYNLIWDNGGFKAVGMDIGDYMPTYYYILAILTYIPIEPLITIKTVSCIADLFVAIFAYKIVCNVTGSKNKGLVAYGTVLFLPSAILNSAGWAQCDGIFTLFILISVYCILKGKDWGAMIAFSVSFVFKIQAIFFAPVLLLLLLKRKMRWRTLIAFPIVYLIDILPAWVAGGNFLDLITVYFRQTGQYDSLNMFLQNAWGLLYGVQSPETGKAGVMFAGGVVLIALFWVYRMRFEITNKIIITLSGLFTLLVPFVLPHMHERYFYLPTIVSLIFAVIYPKRIWVFLIMEFVSFQAHAHYLLGKQEYMDFSFAVLLVTFALATYFKLLYDQMKGAKISKQVAEMAIPPIPVNVPYAQPVKESKVGETADTVNLQEDDQSSKVLASDSVLTQASIDDVSQSR